MRKSCDNLKGFMQKGYYLKGTYIDPTKLTVNKDQEISKNHSI